MDVRKNLEYRLDKFELIIFDLDGTLVDLNVSWIDLKNKLKVYSKSIGLEYNFLSLNNDLFEIRKIYGIQAYSKLSDLVAEYELKKENYVLNKSLLDYIKMNDAKKYAIYSMNTQKCIETFIKMFLKHKVEFIISKDNATFPKPSGIDLKKALGKLSIIKEKIVFVGNSKEDEESGRLAGINTIII